MGWSFMPDQFAIDTMHRREIAPRLGPGAAGKEPLYLAYFLTTSHHPWAVIPPLVEDWSKIGDGSVYGELTARQFGNQFVAGDAYKPAYRTSIEYSLQTIASYLRLLPADDRSLIFIMGDHQPRRPVADIKKDPWYVPVHVLSRDAAAVDRFSRLGYRPGFTPAEPKGNVSGLERFIEELFSAYDPGRAAP